MKIKKTDKFQHTLSRRKALGIAGAGACTMMSNPLDLLINGFANGILNKAHSEETDKIPRNYVHIGFRGGAPRYLWDGPLAPFESLNNIIPNIKTSTEFKSSDTKKLIHNHYKHNIAGIDINLPTLWNSEIPTTSGIWIPMTDMAQNFLMIRGVNLQEDGHPNNYRKQVRPLGSAPSINGLVSDQMSTLLPAVRASSSPTGYRSSKGFSTVGIDTRDSNPLSRMFSSFRPGGDNISSAQVSRRDIVSTLYKSVMDKIGEEAQKNHTASSELFKMRSNAKNTLKEGINDFENAFAPLYDKYAELMKMCYDQNHLMPGISDRKVATSDFDSNLTGKMGGGSYNVDDLRDTIQFSSIQTDYNNKQLNTARYFAITEYLLVNGYCKSILFPFGSPGWAWDEHKGPAVSSLLHISMGFRILSACLHEFTQSLNRQIDPHTGNNLFDETVIHLGGDFNRTPRVDGTGSDHGWQGGNGTLISGIIKKPIVIGNIYAARGSTNGKHYGTWGHGAPVNVNGSNRVLSLGNLSSTITEMLRVKKIFPNEASLIGGVVEGNVYSLIEKAKIVS